MRGGVVSIIYQPIVVVGKKNVYKLFLEIHSSICKLFMYKFFSTQLNGYFAHLSI